MFSFIGMEVKVKMEFTKKFKQIPKGTKHTFGIASAVDLMWRGVAKPDGADEAKKVAGTAKLIKEQDEPKKED